MHPRVKGDATPALIRVGVSLERRGCLLITGRNRPSAASTAAVRIRRSLLAVALDQSGRMLASSGPRIAKASQAARTTNSSALLVHSASRARIVDHPNETSPRQCVPTRARPYRAATTWPMPAARPNIARSLLPPHAPSISSGSESSNTARSNGGAPSRRAIGTHLARDQLASG